MAFAAKALRLAKTVARDKYAWPGGYAMFLVTGDGACLCPACVRQEWSSIVRYTLWKQPSSGWMASAIATAESLDTESPESCAHCGVDLATL